MAYAVITRELDAAAAYAAALGAIGLEAVAMPVTATAPAGDPAELAGALARGGYAAIVVASARAAAALAAARGGAALPEVWAVGPATARALAAAGIAARVPPAVGDAAALARALLAERSLAGCRVLVPRAEGGRDEAIALLRDARAVVDAIVAYRTVPAAAADPALARGLAVLRGGAAVCAVFAPSQVAALDGLVGIRRISAPFAAIGETTATALRAAGAAVVAVADRPTPEGLAKAVSAVYPRRS
ncbi:MAG: uroporphyrinogen-III synthase [Deltaproteobacteria bacterium]|nr:MAG: uroporphyrinogen-III synthase [Deltaproteobacteria bacterium]